MDSHKKGIMIGILATTTAVAVVCAAAFYFGYRQEGEEVEAAAGADDDKRLAAQTQSTAEDSNENQVIQHDKQPKKVDYTSFKNHLKEVVRIQAFFRGFIARRNIALKRKSDDDVSRYFMREERFETFTKYKVFIHGAARENRTEYTYQSGAVYVGQW